MQRIVAATQRYARVAHPVFNTYARASPAQCRRRSTEAQSVPYTPLTEDQLAVIRATAPVVAENALAITKTFYPTMFSNNPETLAFFNPTNQREGSQPEALAASIIAYATNIDSVDAFARSKAVELIATKHVALLVKPEHYGIVGSNLMKAIGAVLGDAVTAEVADAWGAAYQQLADILIDVENKMYVETAALPGGWTGTRDFQVVKKTHEAEDTTSIHLAPVDKAQFAAAKPGQYITIHFGELNGKLTAPRHYTLCNSPGDDTYRIVVRKKDLGVVSTYLNDVTKEGDVLSIAPPAGVMTLDNDDASKNAVFIGGGIGVTTLLPMAKQAHANGQKVGWVTSHVQGKQVLDNEVPADVAYNKTFITPNGDSHLLDVSRDILESIPFAKENTKFYICGPWKMISDVVTKLRDHGVASADICYEIYGPAKSA
eukprot:m.234358 g.234358  ORF g.234358 m.234358 type:complete len:430 (+) comp19319_c0_seq1:224-1513(+)